MNMRALRNLDLNLLVAFAVLMQERHVSRSARLLGVGQPGLSGALARMRRAFDDPLLVRVGTKLQPTPRAFELIGPVERALELIAGAAELTTGFDAAASERVFSIGMTDDHEILFAHAIAKRLRRAAPRARLVVRPVDVHTMAAALDDGTLDVALGVIREDRS